MKVSLTWLQTYFADPLPDADTVADAFTFHSFEMDERDGNLFDLKVLPDRAGYALSHRGAAHELAAALDRPLAKDPLREPLPEYGDLRNTHLEVEIENQIRCPRYIGALVRGVKVGPSPAWLRNALESVGQRSINNVVDATNYVMLDVGQPLHAFDAGKLAATDGAYRIGVRSARDGEKVTTLSGDEYELSPERLLITDANAGTPIGIAGVKGGKQAELDERTTDIIIESANFDGTSVRRTAQRLKLFTDASMRFQNRPSPELCAYGMRDVLALITDIAGGEVVGVTDVYPAPKALPPVSISLERINGLLGSAFSDEEVGDAFRRLDLLYAVHEGIFTVTPSFERTDLAISEDLAEEAGRILGYDRVAPRDLPPIEGEPDQARFRGIERMKDQLVEAGFTEVSTQSFAKKGDIYLANPLDQTKPALRTSLEENLSDALARAKHYAPRVLPLSAKPKLFEVGTVFPNEGERLELRMTEPAWDDVPTHDNLSVAKLEEYGAGYVPKRYALGAFEPFSAYPFVLRDIAAWAPADTPPNVMEDAIRNSAASLLARLDQFDRFENKKDGRISYAYRLVFESAERTLTDLEVNNIMRTVTAALKRAGLEVR